MEKKTLNKYDIFIITFFSLELNVSCSLQPCVKGICIEHIWVCVSPCVCVCDKGQDMMMVLKKDTLSLLDPIDSSLIHCQPIISIRVWGVGCNNGRSVTKMFIPPFSVTPYN